MCVCDEVGKDRILDSMLETDSSPTATRVTLTICRTDPWTAEIRVTGYMGEKYETGNHPQSIREVIVWNQSETFIKRPINYCPICGRRLSLADASRREDE